MCFNSIIYEEIAKVSLGITWYHLVSLSISTAAECSAAVLIYAFSDARFVYIFDQFLTFNIVFHFCVSST